MQANVLVIDDDNVFRQLLVELVTSMKLKCIGAQSADKGLELLKSMSFDLVLLDVMMPGKDGRTALLEIRSNPKLKHIPVIMVTGMSEEGVAASCIESGADDYVTKPFQDTLFRARIKSALDAKFKRDTERNVLETTVSGAVSLLTDVLSSLQPVAFGRAERLRRYCAHTANAIELEYSWDIEMAAMLCDLGTIQLSETVATKLAKREDLSDDERAQHAKSAAFAKGLIGKIPRLQVVAEIVGSQHVAPTPDVRAGSSKDQVAIGTMLLRIVQQFDKHLERLPLDEVVTTLAQSAGQLEAKIVNALNDVPVSKGEADVKRVDLENIPPGAIFADDVTDSRGVLIIPRHSQATDVARGRLQSYVDSDRVKNSFLIVAS